MPKIDNIEETPNPNAVKFILKEPVTAGTTRSFHSAAEAAGDPLAGPRLAVPIRAAESVASNGGAAPQPSAQGVGGPLGALMSDDPRLARINEILDEKVRPYLASDGGWLELLSLQDK